MKRDNIFKPLATFIIVLLVTVIVVMLCSGSFESETVESETVETTEVESNLFSLYEERFSAYDENITASKNKEVFLFSTANKEEFLNFLEDFDYVSYEIIEITLLPATPQTYTVLYKVQYF